MSSEPPAAGGNASPQQTLELYAYLACMGPDAFDPSTARRLVCGPMSRPAHRAAVDRLTDVVNRDSVSREVGLALAGVLSQRARVSSLELGGILPRMLSVDLARGFAVLHELAVAATPALAEPLGDILMNLAFSAQPDPATNGDGRTRQAFLIETLTTLPLDAPARTRMFLALSQTLRAPDLIRDILSSSLFPAEPEDALAVLAEGNDDALRTLLQGALVRDDGREAFLAACKAAVEPGPARGIPLLARLDPLLHAGEAGLRTLESAVRATVLGAVERALARDRQVSAWMPDDPDPNTLRLMALVSPGLQEPGRTLVCDWILDRAAARMRHESGYAALVEALVGAASMHERPTAAGIRVRKALLEAAGALRIRIVAVGTPAPEDLARARAFEQFAGRIGTEFRRRRPLAGALEGALPYLTDLTRIPTDELHLTLGDDAAPAP